MRTSHISGVVVPKICSYSVRLEHVQRVVSPRTCKKLSKFIIVEFKFI